MDKKDYALVGVSLALLISLGVNIIELPSPNYQCDSRELQAYCFELSSTGKTCYTLPNKVGGKVCTEGWVEIEDIKENIIEAGLRLSCTNNGCIEVN